MHRSFTFDITKERFNRITDFIKDKREFNNISAFINYTIDFYIEKRRSKMITDILYYLGFPIGIFIIFASVSLYLKDTLFFILTGIVAVYLIILCFLFVDKYGGLRNNRKNGS